MSGRSEPGEGKKNKKKHTHTHRDFPKNNLTPEFQELRSKAAPKRIGTRDVLVLTPSNVQTQAGGAEYVSCCVCLQAA